MVISLIYSPAEKIKNGLEAGSAFIFLLIIFIITIQLLFLLFAKKHNRKIRIKKGIKTSLILLILPILLFLFSSYVFLPLTDFIIGSETEFNHKPRPHINSRGANG